MIISDLNHIEVVSEETETRIEGGFLYTFSYTAPSYSVVTAAKAGAKGQTTSTSTFTSTNRSGSGGSSIVSTTVSFSWW